MSFWLLWSATNKSPAPTVSSTKVAKKVTWGDDSKQSIKVTSEIQLGKAYPDFDFTLPPDLKFIFEEDAKAEVLAEENACKRKEAAKCVDKAAQCADAIEKINAEGQKHAREAKNHDAEAQMYDSKTSTINAKTRIMRMRMMYNLPSAQNLNMAGLRDMESHTMFFSDLKLSEDLETASQLSNCPQTVAKGSSRVMAMGGKDLLTPH